MNIAVEDTRLLNGAIRKQILEASDHRCHYCGCRIIDEKLGHDSPYARRVAAELGIDVKNDWLKKLGHRRATIDHLVPVSQGGSDDASNFVAACSFDNSRRGDMAYEDYLELVEDLIEEGEHPCR